MMLRAASFLRWTLLGVLLFASGALLWYGAVHDAAIVDELAHIPAGYSYVNYLDFRLNPEHPPLLKALSGLPLLALDLNFPLDKQSWQSDVNGQWAAGAQFLYESGNDAHKVILLSRIAPIALTLFLVLAVYLLAARLLGRSWAFLPALFTALSPSFLAHGHYVTTDVAAAFGIFIATWSFIALLHKPSGGRAVVAGLCFGIAQLLKFSAILLVPYLSFLALVFFAAVVWRDPKSWRRGARLFLWAAAAMAVGGVLIYATYALFTLNYPAERQLSDTVFILESYGKGPTPPGEPCRPVRCPADLAIGMTKQKILRPAAQYLLGLLMVVQRSSGGNTGYFLGEVSAAGWRSYFPVTYALKEPLSILLFVALGTLLGIGGILRAIRRRAWRFSEYLAINFYEFAMLAFVILYWAWSIQSPLNIGVRHLLPTLPFIAILATGAIKRRCEEKRWCALALAALVIVFLVETLSAWPYHLSYFNRAGGGIENGYRYVTDSNYDWGQDLYRLRDWVDANAVQRIAVDYFGGGSPRYELGNAFMPWWSARNNPKEEGIEWLAVSVNTLQNTQGKPAPGFIRKPEDEYRWLSAVLDPHKPYARAGTSIFIYKL